MKLDYSIVKAKFLKKFDLVGIISYQTYQEKLGFADAKYKSLIVVGKNYYRNQKHTTGFQPALFAQGKDYHQVMTELFKSVEMENKGVFYVDNSPFNEKLAGYLAGFGFIGHNQLLINPEYGSFFFLGISALSEEFNNYDQPFKNFSCSSCRKCESACPTKALTPTYQKEKCKSFITQKNIIGSSENFSDDIILGCDLCQTVCPYNARLKFSDIFIDSGDSFNLKELLSLSKNEFKEMYKDYTYHYLNPEVIAKNIILRLLYKKDYLKLRKYKDLILNKESLRSLYLDHEKEIENG
ncbi:MAG: 4Fe-4S dicluster domain-containing protein [Erysipelotrichales bacterium]|nr:4Fe-4S dicluster domain-containing protein [Erysipelotrichales bacterium]